MQANFTTTHQPSHLEILRSDLTQFGLNPKEWLINPTLENEFVISNEKDSSFQFSGKVDQDAESPVWQSIQLLSI